MVELSLCAAWKLMWIVGVWLQSFWTSAWGGSIDEGISDVGKSVSCRAIGSGAWSTSSCYTSRSVFDSCQARVWFAVGSVLPVLVLVLVLVQAILPVIFVQRREIKVLSERTARNLSSLISIRTYSWFFYVHTLHCYWLLFIICTNKCTHTHTHTYKYIYIYNK